MNTYTNIYLFLFLSFFSCGKSNDAQDKERKDDFITFMSDKPYLGSAKSRLYLHGYEGLPSVEGTGSLSIANVSGDSVTLALICELSSGDGFRFGLPGKQLGKEWTAVSSTGTFAIRENGKIVGDIRTADQEISWDGQLFSDRVMLDIKLKYLTTQENITAGSIVSTHLDLSRVSDASQTGNTNGCRTIVWENRSVFNLYSGGVDLIRVPVCHN